MKNIFLTIAVLVMITIGIKRFLLKVKVKSIKPEDYNSPESLAIRHQFSNWTILLFVVGIIILCIGYSIGL